MNKTPKKEQFSLSKVKVNIAKGFVEFQATLSYTEGDDVIKPQLNDKYPVMPHPDLVDQLNKLKRPLAKTHGLIDLEWIVDQEIFGATKAQQVYAANHTEEQLRKITVTGISLSGEEKNRGVVITGVFDNQAINSKRLKFSGTKYGFETELEEICDAVEDETFEFAFKGKKAVLELFGEPEDEEEVPDGKMAAAGDD